MQILYHSNFKNTETNHKRDANVAAHPNTMEEEGDERATRSCKR